MKFMTKNDFIVAFYSAFAKNILPNDKKKYNITIGKKGLLWDIFAAKLVPCYEGNNARTFFDTIDKTGAMEIHYSGHNRFGKDDKATSVLSCNHMKSKYIDDSGLIEFYVIGRNFEWCYVVTHELDLCGPYFCFKQ